MMSHRSTLAILGLLVSSVTFYTTAAQHSGHDMSSHQMPSSQEKSHNEVVNSDIISSKGTIKLIDLDAKKVTIAHEPIPALNWPEMTMRFTFTDPSLFDNLKAEDNVDFTFIQQGNISLLQQIAATK